MLVLRECGENFPRPQAILRHRLLRAPSGCVTNDKIAGEDKLRRFAFSGDLPMLHLQDLFQWDRFITPSIIKSFYWLVMVLIFLFGISGVFSALTLMAVSPFGGFVALLAALAGTLVGLILSRIAAEFILIVFRINEHLGAIRDQGRMR